MIPLERPLDSVAKPLSSLVVWVVVMSGKYVEVRNNGGKRKCCLPFCCEDENLIQYSSTIISNFQKMVQRLPLLLCLVASFIATASPMQCNFGSTTPDKASAPPPPPPREGITFTCNPPHPVGKGTVTLDSMMMEGKEKEEDGYSPSPTTSSSSPYIDAQIFSYASDPSPLLPAAVSATPTRRASLVNVAALALGADGGCATGACSPPESEYCPPGYPGHPTSKANGTQRIIDYLTEVSTADPQWPN